MPKRIPLSAIGVQRNGKTIYPKVGEVFDFTAEEVADLVKLEKSSKTSLIRKPVNEDPAGSDDSSSEVADKYAGLTVAQLKAQAAERQIDLGEATTKDAILTVLRAADAAADEEDL